MAGKKNKETKRDDILDGSTGIYQDQHDSMSPLPGWENKEKKEQKAKRK